MDALARLAPAAWPLVEQADSVLATHGAPPTHAVWPLLGSLGATPAAVFTFVCGLEPEPLRGLAASLREEERTYERLEIPREAAWAGAAAQDYGSTAAALRDHTAGAGVASLAGRLRATASYVEGVARVQQDLRDGVARVAADLPSSAGAVALRTFRHQDDTAALTAAVLAAADIGAALLRVSQGGAQALREAVRGAAEIDELPYRPPALTPRAYDATIRLP